LELQLGGKGLSPMSLAVLSDWGEWERPTALQFQGWRV